MRVYIAVIPHKDQAYPTVGNWWWEGDTLEIRVSDVKNWKMEMCVAIHELTEALLCKARGITQARVDKFDMGPVGSADPEPGEHPKAPYRREHRAAHVPEFALMDGLDVDIREYNRKLEGLYE